MSKSTDEAQRTLDALVLSHVDCLLRTMLAEGVENPPAALRVLMRRNPALPANALALRYGPMLRAIRAVFQFRGNDTAVEAAIEGGIDLCESLL